MDNLVVKLLNGLRVTIPPSTESFERRRHDYKVNKNLEVAVPLNGNIANDASSTARAYYIRFNHTRGFNA